MEASIVSKKSKVWVILVPAIILLVLLCGVVVGFTVLGNNAGDKVLTQDLSESLGDATAAKFEFNVGTGNLTIDRLAGGEQLLASGTLQYLESQGRPTGTLDMILPDGASDLSVTAKTGGGNVTVVVGSDITGTNTVIATSGAGKVVVRLPGGIAARIHAASGMGKLTIDPQFTKIDDHTYQSPDYTHAADKIEITVESGAGNVSVITK